MKRNLLTMALAIYSLLGVAQVPTYVPTDGLVGYWPFNGNANDESGNGNDGTMNGVTSTEDRFGNSNAAFFFNNSASILVPNSSSLNNMSEITFNCYIKASSFSPSEDYLVSRWLNNNNNSRFWGFRANTNGQPYIHPWAEFSISSSYNTCGQSSEAASLQTNEERMLTCSFGNGSLKIYIDGQLVHSCNIAGILTATTTNMLFGHDGYDGFFHGVIDDIGIWNRALTQEEIQVLFSSCNILPTTIAGNLSPFTLTSADYACNNNPGSTYQWTVTNGVITAGQGTSNVTVLWGSEGAGTLTVVETNADGCGGAPVTINVDVVCATTASTIDGPLGPNALTETTYTCNGVEGSTYQWTISNGVITSGQGTNEITVLWAGNGLGSISVQETTNANCTGEVISIDVVVIPTSVDELDTNALMLYYPNPTSNSLTMEFGKNILSSGYSVRIMNSIGQIIHSAKVLNTNEIIDVSTWSSGTYVIAVLNDTGTEVQTKTLIIH